MSSSDISQLTAMGFDESSARDALASAGGNVETAVNILLGVIPPPAAAPSSRTATSTANVGDMIVCPTSQYSVDNGRSACTCIALTAATNFLQQATSGGSVTLNVDFLQNMILNGVQNYQTLSSASPVEHSSAEEILLLDQGICFPLSVMGGIRQGILGNEAMGFQAQLEGILHEQQGQSNSAYIAVLITKTPETVLVCLPLSSNGGAFWLIDSHPRSHNLGADGSYAKPHPDLRSLLLSLDSIFPSTDLGPDIPEMMLMMYNSFDMYPLQLK